MGSSVRLGVNIDHVATLREARGGVDPSLIAAAEIVQKAGASGITMHLREDRRHVQDDDMFAVREVADYLNMEMAIAPEIVSIALEIKPDICCLVPEKRQELTTEGGLDVVGNLEDIKTVVGRLQDDGIDVSLFIDPVEEQIEAARIVGATHIELHTGEYARGYEPKDLGADGLLTINDNPGVMDGGGVLSELVVGVAFAQRLGLIVNAGHGLDYNNVVDVAKIPGVYELNIGHSIVCRAVFVGLKQAVTEMVDLLSFD